MRYTLFLLTILIFSSCVQRQVLQSTDVIVEPSTDAMKMKSLCNQSSAYIPDSTIPIRHIRVNFHIMQDSKGNYNFSEEEGTAYAIDLYNHMNKYVADNQKMKQPPNNNTPVLPTRFKYVLTPRADDPDDDGIYFHRDDDLYYYVVRGRNANLASTGVLKKYGVQKDTVLNIFIMPHHPDSVISKTYKATVSGIAFPGNNFIKQAGAFRASRDTMHFKKTGTKLAKGAWMVAASVNHEVGHILSLHHTWAFNDGCDDTPRNPNCWAYNPKPPCNTRNSNNVMDYNTYQNAWTPCQLGKVHAKMSNKNTSQRKILVKTWCERKPEATIYIRDTVEWNGARDLEGDVVVENGGFLRIGCRVSIPKGGKIIVKPTGQLVLDDAFLENDCGEIWDGIEIWSRGTRKGKVIFERAPRFRNMKKDLDFDVIYKLEKQEKL